MSQTSPKPLPPNHQPKTPNLEPSETLTLAGFKGFVAGSGKHRGCPGADLFEPSRRGFRLVVVTVGVQTFGGSGWLHLAAWGAGFLVLRASVFRNIRFVLVHCHRRCTRVLLCMKSHTVYFWGRLYALFSADERSWTYTYVHMYLCVCM